MFLQSVVFLILWNIYLSFGTQNDLKLMRQNLNSSTHGKQKRALYFTTTTGISMGVALSVPVDNGRGDVFVSYCVTAGYGVPAYSDNFSELDPKPFQGIFGEDEERKSRMVKSDSRKILKKVKRTKKVRNRVITRRKMYRTIERNLLDNRLSTSCLLKAICEVNQQNYGEHNGLLGDIFHIVFTPSTSQHENLPIRYYEAEQNGNLGLCKQIYEDNCPLGMLDLIAFLEQ